MVLKAGRNIPLGLWNPDVSQLGLGHVVIPLLTFNSKVSTSMFFQHSRQVDARGSTFQDIGRDHVIIYTPHMTNIFIGMTDLGLGVANNSNPGPPLHSASLPELSSTISGTLPTLSEIDTTIPPESDRDTATTPSYFQTDSKYSPISHTSTASMRPATLSLAESTERQVSQFMGEGYSIQPATLESLIDQLITDLSDVGSARAVEYRDTFFTTCVAFTTHYNVFENLEHRFREAEARPAQHRSHLRIDVIMLMKYWVLNPHLTVDNDVLARIQGFAMSIQSPPTMNKLAIDLHSVVTQRLQPPSHPPSSALPEISSNINPKNLAIALMMLEGDKYARILPGDYISHLRRPGENDNIQAAYTTINQIKNWVQYSILRYDDLEMRSNTFTFLARTAEESRKIRNFASMSAIVTALQAPKITCLGVTYNSLSKDVKQMIERMNKLLDPSRNYHAYKAVWKDSCIPLLNVHIHDMRIEFSKGADTVETQGVPMINFAKWTQVHNCVKDVLRRKPPDVSKYRQKNAGVLAYLEDQLYNTPASQYLAKLSSRLKQQEQEILKRLETIGGLHAVGMARSRS